MKKKLPVLLAVFLIVGAPLEANPIERACNGSDQSAANARLCSCIGNVARTTLSRSEMRQAARFFRDPARAEQVRMSDRSSDEAFWDRYSDFGEAAESQCS
jgi:hypothetical protein